MTFGFRNRKLIQYSLMVCTLLVQIIILLFFYNEYFNKNKLSEIQEQILEARKLKRLTDESKQALLTAHNYLNDYIEHPSKIGLNRYFHSLKGVTEKIDSTQNFERIMPSLTKIVDSEDLKKDLKKLKILIDSIYKFSPKFASKEPQFKVEPFNIENMPQEMERTEKHITDSLPRSSLFTRLKDALKGNEKVRTDTVLIEMKYQHP